MTHESFGKAHDGEVLYIVHSTFCHLDLSTAVRGALLRKLFTVCGMPIANQNEELPFFNGLDSSGFRLVFETSNVTSGVYNSTSYDTLDNQSFFGLLSAWGTFRDYFNGLFNGATDEEPMHLRLYSHDNNIAAVNYRLIGQLNLRNEFMTVGVVSELKVQNRTGSDLATEAEIHEADRLDSQPLIVRSYLFRNGDPRERNPANTVENAGHANLSGCPTFQHPRIVRGQELVLQNFQNRPEPQYFSNCIKKSDTILQPGSMKKTSIYSTHKGVVANLLKWLQPSEQNNGDRQGGCPGKSQMLCFEEKMRTSGVNKVTINYEKKIKIAVILATTKGPAFTTALSSAAHNNAP